MLDAFEIAVVLEPPNLPNRPPTKLPRPEMVPELLSVVDVTLPDNSLRLPNNPPTELPPEIVPVFESVPLKTRLEPPVVMPPIMPPIEAAPVSSTVPVFVRLFAMAKLPTSPKMPPMPTMPAELVTFSAFVSVCTLPEIAFEARLPNKPPILFVVPEIVLVDT